MTQKPHRQPDTRLIQQQAPPNKGKSAARPALKTPPKYTPTQQTIERAARVYFDLCRRLARSINRIKARQKRR